MCFGDVLQFSCIHNDIYTWNFIIDARQTLEFFQPFWREGIGASRNNIPSDIRPNSYESNCDLSLVNIPIINVDFFKKKTSESCQIHTLSIILGMENRNPPPIFQMHSFSLF